MLKGLKKKIKGKKGKHDDDDDLFDPEKLEQLKAELEAKKRQQQNAEQEESGSRPAAAAPKEVPKEEDEEWAKFKLLTSGVDNLVKQTSEKLGEIKETSFYQRKVTDPTNLWRPEGHKPEAAEEPVPEEEVKSPSPPPEEPEPEVVAPEDVTPVEVEDDLFDTSYLDAIASGEIQLNYIPDSPTEEDLGPDPFDTSGVADVVKRIEEAEKRAKRQVNLGSAVEALSGKGGSSSASAATTTARPRAGDRGRARPRPVNLLGDFDHEPPEPPKVYDKPLVLEEPKKGILDELLASPTKDSLPEAPLLESTAPVVGEFVPIVIAGGKVAEEKKELRELLGEFDLIGQSKEEEENSSLQLVGSSVGLLKSLLEPDPSPEDDEFDAEFAELASSRTPKPEELEELEEPEEEDPFDTAFVEKVIVIPEESKHEKLKEDSFDFDPRAGEVKLLVDNIPEKSLLEADHSPTVESLPSLDPTFVAAPTGQLFEPVTPTGADPFDTSTVKVVAPGRAELKLLEEELLNAELEPLAPKISALAAKLSAPPPEEDDFDFDPRADEKKLDLFDHPEEQLPSAEEKVLTPCTAPEEEEQDPFDTSCVSHLDLGPGQLELKLLASELTADLAPTTNNPGAGGEEEGQEDFDFDPRKDEEQDPFVVIVSNQQLKTEDIFGDPGEEHLAVKDKVLTPTNPKSFEEQEQHQDLFETEDPFDTSAIEVIKLLPASELRQIHEEILAAPEFSGGVSQVKLKAAFSAPAVPIQAYELKPQELEEAPELHLLEEEDPFHTSVDHRPLTPVEIAGELDPFDTSFAVGVVPGKTEIRILEQELLRERRLSDPDFDPRGLPFAAAPIHPASLSFVSKTLEPQKAEGVQTTASVSNPVTVTDLKALEAELL